MKNKRILIVIIVILITLIVAGIILYIHKKGNDSSESAKEIVVTNNIEKYGYVLTDNDTDYYKELFEKLKNTLNEETVDEEKYVNLVSQLFVTDFYTLSNKLNSSDIGGLQYILASSRDNFALKAKDTMYKTVKSNVYGNREQILPKVTKVSVDSFTNTTYKYGDTTDDKAYSVKCSVTYSEDLGYPSTVKLILVHIDEKIEVAKVN